MMIHYGSSGIYALRDHRCTDLYLNCDLDPTIGRECPCPSSHDEKSRRQSYHHLYQYDFVMNHHGCRLIITRSTYRRDYYHDVRKDI